MALLRQDETLVLAACPQLSSWRRGPACLYKTVGIQLVSRYKDPELDSDLLASSFSFVRLIYMPETHTFVTIESTPEPFLVPPEDHAVGTDAIASSEGNQGGESTSQAHPLAARMPRQRIVLICADAHTIIDRPATLQLLPYERVTAHAIVTLPTSTTASRLQSFLLIGTTFQRGEDRPVRGRILRIDVIPVNPHPQFPSLKYKLKRLEAEDVKGNEKSRQPYGSLFLA
jgi:hypothetical protein